MGTYRPRSTPPRFDRPQSPRSTQSRLETCRSTSPRPTTVELQKVWVIVIVIYKQNKARYSVWTHVIKVKRVKILIIILQDEVNVCIVDTLYDVEFDLTLRWTSWPGRIIFRLCWFLISPFNFFFTILHINLSTTVILHCSPNIQSCRILPQTTVHKH